MWEQVTECLVKNNKVLTSGNELRLKEEGWRSAANIGKIIGSRQVSYGNFRNFIAFFPPFYFHVLFPRETEDILSGHGSSIHALFHLLTSLNKLRKMVYGSMVC